MDHLSLVYILAVLISYAGAALIAYSMLREAIMHPETASGWVRVAAVLLSLCGFGYLPLIALSFAGALMLPPLAIPGLLCSCQLILWMKLAKTGQYPFKTALTFWLVSTGVHLFGLVVQIPFREADEPYFRTMFIYTALVAAFSALMVLTSLLKRVWKRALAIDRSASEAASI